MTLWSTYFIIRWDRHTAELDITWNDYVIEDDEEDLRKEFKGEPMINPVTGNIEMGYPNSKRYLKYLQSFFICLPPFIIVFFV